MTASDLPVPGEPNSGDNTTASVLSSENSSSAPVEDDRITALRVSLGVGDDYPIDVLQAILDANIREEEEMRNSQIRSQQNLSRNLSQSSRDSISSSSVTRSSSSRRTRTWEPCQPAPSRPGAVSLGDFHGDLNVGQMDEAELLSRRINAVHSVQESLNATLGYDLRARGGYEEMQRAYEEGERMLVSSGLERRTEPLGPALTMWEAPPPKEMKLGKEPQLPPPPEEPLPLHLSSVGDASAGGISNDDATENGGSGGNIANSEICMGIFVDPGPDRSEDDEKQEESSTGGSYQTSWADVSADDNTSLGPYDRIVRCWKCRAGLKVKMDLGLVACPRCSTVSPTTDVAQVK